MGEMNAASNTEQAVTRTAEQSHLTALAERDALTAQVEALTAQLAQAKAARRGATGLFKLACERAEALTAQRDEAVRLIRLAEPGPLTAATRWWDESAALLRGVKR